MRLGRPLGKLGILGLVGKEPKVRMTRLRHNNTEHAVMCVSVAIQENWYDYSFSLVRSCLVRSCSARLPSSLGLAIEQQWQVEVLPTYAMTDCSSCQYSSPCPSRSCGISSKSARNSSSSSSSSNNISSPTWF